MASRSSRGMSATSPAQAWLFSIPGPTNPEAGCAEAHRAARSCYDLRLVTVSGRPPMPQTYDRSAEDLGNAIHFEHVNVTIPDQRLATLFYVTGLGLTRDPYLNVSDNNMWINVGPSPFHLPTGTPQVLRGTTGIGIAGRAALLERLAGARKKLERTP